MSSDTFELAGELRRACRGKNTLIEAWIAQNLASLNLASTPHKSTISNALNGKHVSVDLIGALTAMLNHIYDDPWAWLEPPNEIDKLDQYASLQWWYDTLDLHEIPANTWARIKVRGLTPEQYRVVERNYNDWSRRLRTACERFAEDRALVRALEADDEPEFQVFNLIDGEWCAGSHHIGSTRTVRGRVGNPGLHGRSLEDVGMALALQNVNMSLPDIERACSTYRRPEPEQIDAWDTDPVEPFMGDAFDGVEVNSGYDPQFNNVASPPRLESKWRIRFWWDGQRYQVEDVEPFAQVREHARQEWRDVTEQEREFWITGMERMETRAEYLERVDKREWIDNLLASPGALKFAVDKEAEAESRWQWRVDHIDDEAARQHNAEIERRLRKFRRSLRRRGSNEACS